MDLIKDMDERIAYVKTLIHMASIDKNILETETEQINQLAQLYQIPGDRMQEIWNYTQEKSDLHSIVSQIQGRKTKLMLLYELLMVCHADKMYGPAEQTGMNEICGMLGIEKDKLHELERLIVESQNIGNKLKVALEMGGY
ncbi:MAG: TerB family tellurite resistance protein [Syntrophomonadaceae bacterium]